MLRSDIRRTTSWSEWGRELPFYRPNYVLMTPRHGRGEAGPLGSEHLYLEVLSERGLLGGLTFALIWVVFLRPDGARTESISEPLRTCNDSPG